MADIDWDTAIAELDKLDTRQGISAGGSPEAAAPSVDSIDWDAAIAELDDLYDPATGELKPAYALGDRPETAINKSLLSAEARLKLSFADDRGKEKFLRERFEDVARDDNGDWMIKADNRWHRADAKGLGDKDPWALAKDVAAGRTRFADALDEASREIVGDVADVAQEGSLMAASTIAAVMTGGSSLLAQGAAAVGAGAIAKGATTSLGRIMGTYDATPEEQVQDIALEGVLNAAGVGVAAGVSRFGAPMAKKLGTGLAKLPKASFEMVRDRLAVWAGVPAASVNFAVTNADDVARAAAQVSAAGNTADDFVKRTLIESTESLAAKAQPVLSSAWKKISNEIAEEAGEKGVANAAKISNEVFIDAVERGFGTFLKKEGDEFVEVAADAMPELLKGLREGRKLAKGITFGVKSINAIAKAAQQGNDELLEIANNKEAYKALSEFYKDSWRGFSNLSAKSGPEAVKRLMSANKIINDRLWTLRQLGEDRGIASLQTFSANLNAKISNGTLQQMNALGVGKKFAELNSLYSTGKTEFGELLKVAQAAKNGNPAALEVLTNKFTSGSGKNVLAKDAQTALLDFTKKYAPEMASSVQQDLNKFMAYRSAAAFDPWVRKGYLSTIGGVGVVGGTLSGNPTAALMAGAGLVATSPKAVKGMVNAQRAVNAIASTPASMAMLRGLRTASSRVGASKAAEFFRQPEALSAFLQAVHQAPELKQQIDGAVTQSLQGTVGGQQ